MRFNFPRKSQFFAALAASGGAFCAGNVLGWTSPSAPRLLNDQQHFPISAVQWSWIASIYNVGCALSCLIIGLLMDTFGRKTTMLGLVVPFLIGWMLLTFAQNFMMLLVGRFILGVAGGAFYLTTPQFTSEIAEKEIRGILGSFLQLFIALGVLFVYIFGAFFSVFYLNVVCTIFPLIFAAIFFKIPESPFFLIHKKREREAEKALQWLRSENFDTQREIREIKENLRMNEVKIPLKVDIKKKASISALIIGAGLLYFRHMACIIPILFYATTIFEISGVGLSADVSTIILGSMQLFSSLMASILVDRVGRRILLLGSIFTMAISLLVIGGFFYIQSINKELAADYGWVPLTSLCIYILAYPIGYGGVPWLVVSEISPTSIKSFCGPLIGFFAWNFAFLVTTSFPSLMEIFGVGQTFWIFGVASILGIFFTYFIVPETKGKSLAEIEAILSGQG